MSIDIATTLRYMHPSATWVMLGVSSYENLQWLDGEIIPPTWEEIEAAWSELEAMSPSAMTDLSDVRESIVAKLLVLGFSETEAELIVGGS